MTDRTRRAPHARKSLLMTGFGLLLVLLSAVLFATAPGVRADQLAYAAATACPAGTQSDSCTTTGPATVVSKKEEQRRTSHMYWLLLTEKGSHSTQRVEMTGPEPVYNAVRAGDEVTLTYWRGEIRAVTFGAAAQQTVGSSTDDWRFFLGSGLFVLLFGLGALWAGWWHRYRYPTATQADAWHLTVGPVAGAALGLLGFLAAGTSGGAGDVSLIMAVGLPPVLMLAVLYTVVRLRRTRRATDPSGVVPVPPTGRRCVPATVRGDVPYSVDGFDHLVVGDGRPAATPDPFGNLARRPLPETLTVQSVRPLRPDDPVAWLSTFKRDGVVIECQDGDRTVLITTARRAAPVILGALLTKTDHQQPR
ncbi:hypothetical protein [Streptomyces sp. DSM 40750]|uniref:hypothetical protein n=1 Tax=Streptomyces sp. DSM 40750 TaxID=2801030 RepID=UPI00214CF51B|nr:hypothetical protein [Streptomyces sp. DSM 40750]UUU25727.1 hypothetical protein JIX55_38780 [Streptomyces sp. DSM 40750]